MRRSKKASVLLIVLITIVLTSLALVNFIERASNDLLVEARAAEASRLRVDAYSALEVTLAVLSEFSQADNGLHSPAEGWSDPLAFAAYDPPSGRTVEVTFEDESGKLSLPHASASQLLSIFQGWGLSSSDSQQLTDALLTWMRNNYVPTTTVGTNAYDNAPIPYVPPQRSLRSFSELAAIDFVRQKFYDESGVPNDLWRKFVAAFSLYNFSQPNLNSAQPDTMTALGQSNPAQQQQLSDYLKGTGEYKQQGPGYFKTTTDANNLFGAQNMPQGVGTQIQALRITVTVHEANTSFVLSTVIAPPNGAKPVASTEQVVSSTGTTTANTSNASDVSSTTANNNNNSNPDGSTPASASQNSANEPGQPTGSTQSSPGQSGASTTTVNVPQLNYPFTLLEIHEQILENTANPVPPPATAPSV